VLLLEKLAGDEDEDVCRKVAGNPNTPASLVEKLEAEDVSAAKIKLIREKPLDIWGKKLENVWVAEIVEDLQDGRWEGFIGDKIAIDISSLNGKIESGQVIDVDVSNRPTSLDFYKVVLLK